MKSDFVVKNFECNHDSLEDFLNDVYGRSSVDPVKVMTIRSFLIDLAEKGATISYSSLFDLFKLSKFNITDYLSSIIKIDIKMNRPPVSAIVVSWVTKLPNEKMIDTLFYFLDQQSKLPKKGIDMQTSYEFAEDFISFAASFYSDINVVEDFSDSRDIDNVFYKRFGEYLIEVCHCFYSNKIERK